MLKLCLVLGAALLLAVPVVQAAEEGPSREEYVQRVDSICKKNGDANERILKGVKQQITKKRQLVPAGNRFLRASRSFGRAIKQIGRVPQPTADQSTLSSWIKYLKAEESLLQKIGKALKAKKTGRANNMAVRLSRTTRRANRLVVGFEFDHCDREVQIG